MSARLVPTLPAADQAEITYAGPWHVVQAHDGCWRVREGLTVWMWRATREAAQAAADEENRRWRQRQVELAAPDMLTALKALIGIYDNEDDPNQGMKFSDRLKLVRTAIAKAEPSA